MRQIILSLSIVTLCSTAFAQEAADKKFQAGLITAFGMNFVEMGTTRFTSDGIGSDVTIGANLNFSFTESIGLNTGVEIDFESLKFRTSGEPVYYHFRDKEIIRESEVTAADPLYQVLTRKQKPIYISIPTMLLFRTKFIGYFRYFGKFGVRTSILATNKSYDTGLEYNPGENPTLFPGTSVNHENMTSSGEMLFMKAVGGFSGGAEWNFTGTTSLVAELGFYFGITPLYVNRKAGKQYLYQTDSATGTVNEYFSNSAKHNQLRFKLSILF